MGKPVDALDRMCLRYKRCQECARSEGAHGQTCIGDEKRYTWYTNWLGVILRNA